MAIRPSQSCTALPETSDTPFWACSCLCHASFATKSRVSVLIPRTFQSALPGTVGGPPSFRIQLLYSCTLSRTLSRKRPFFRWCTWPVAQTSAPKEFTPSSSERNKKRHILMVFLSPLCVTCQHSTKSNFEYFRMCSITIYFDDGS